MMMDMLRYINFVVRYNFYMYIVIVERIVMVVDRVWMVEIDRVVVWMMMVGMIVVVNIVWIMWMLVRMVLMVLML